MLEPRETTTAVSPAKPGGTVEPPEGRRSRRRRELHQSILATAAELFARDGYDATTVEKIAAAADIAPATFFNHFRSKEDVLREVGQDVFSRFRRLVDEQLARPVSTLERLQGFAERSADLVRRAPEMTRRVLMAVLRTSRPGEAGAELASMQADFARLLEKGREGASDIPEDLDLDLASEILVSVVIGAMTHWINDPAYPLEQRMRQSLSLLGDRLLAPPPETRDRYGFSPAAPSPPPSARKSASPSATRPRPKAARKTP